MTSFMFLILTTVIAIAFARYNESNKLFWTLFISMMMGIAGWTFYQKINSDEIKQSSVQVNPTQGLEITSDTFIMSLAEVDLTTNTDLFQNPVGKEETFTFNNEQSVACLSVFNADVPTNPPEKYLLFNTS